MAYNKPCLYCSNQSIDIQNTCPLVLAYDIPTLCINEPREANIIHLQNEFWFTFIEHILSTLRKNNTSVSSLPPPMIPYLVTPFQIEQLCFPSAGFRPSNIGKVLFRLSSRPPKTSSSSTQPSSSPLLLQRSILPSLDTCINYHQRSLTTTDTSNEGESSSILTSLVSSSSSFVMSALTASFSALSLLLPPSTAVPTDEEEEHEDTLTSSSQNSLIPTNPHEEYLHTSSIDTIIMTLLQTVHHYFSPSSSTTNKYVAIYLYSSSSSSSSSSSVQRYNHPTLPTSTSSPPLLSLPEVFNQSPFLQTFLLPNTSTSSPPLLSLPEVFNQSPFLQTFLLPNTVTMHKDTLYSSSSITTTSTTTNSSTTAAPNSPLLLHLHEHIYTIILPRLIMQGYGTLLLDSSTATPTTDNKVLILSLPSLSSVLSLGTTVRTDPGLVLSTPTRTTTSTNNNTSLTTSLSTTPIKSSPLPGRGNYLATSVSSPYTAFSPLRVPNNDNTQISSPVPLGTVVIPSFSSFSPIYLPTVNFVYNEMDIDKALTTLIIHHQLSILHQRLESYDTLRIRLSYQALQAKQKNNLIECKFLIKRKLLIEKTKQGIYSKIFNIEKTMTAIEDASDNIVHMNLLTQANTTLKQLSSAVNTDRMETTLAQLQERFEDIEDISNLLNQDMNDKEINSTDVDQEIDNLDEWFTRDNSLPNGTTTTTTTASVIGTPFSSTAVEPTLETNVSLPSPPNSASSSTTTIVVPRIILTE